MLSGTISSKYHAGMPVRKMCIHYMLRLINNPTLCVCVCVCVYSLVTIFSPFHDLNLDPPSSALHRFVP